MTRTKCLGLLGAAFLVFAPELPGTPGAVQEKQQKPQAEEQEAPPTVAEKEIEQKACGPKDVKHSVETNKTQHPTPEPPPIRL